MSKLFLSLTLSILLQASPPNWYVENNLNHKEYENIGYGVGSSKAEAKKRARVDISNSLQIIIKSSIKLKTTLSNNIYSDSINENIEENSLANLEGLTTLKSEYRDGKYYIALQYINLPFAKKVRLKFKDITTIEKEKNSYLLQSLLLQELKSEFEFYPKVLIDKGTLIIGDKSFHITKDILKKLFSSISNNNIQLNIPKKLKDREYYFIDITLNKSGYVTLFQIYENGETSLLFENRRGTNKSKLEYPDREEYNGLQTYLEDTQTKAKDLTIALLCQERKDFSYFDNISTMQEKYAKLYGKLFLMLDGCDVSSEVLSID